MCFPFLQMPSDEALVFQLGKPLRVAEQSFAAGNGDLFFKVGRVHQGVRGRSVLRNRKKQHVSGDAGNTTHREFLTAYPDKSERPAFTNTDVSLAWLVAETNSLAELDKKKPITALRPQWKKLL